MRCVEGLFRPHGLPGVAVEEWPGASATRIYTRRSFQPNDGTTGTGVHDHGRSVLDLLPGSSPEGPCCQTVNMPLDQPLAWAAEHGESDWH